MKTTFQPLPICYKSSSVDTGAVAQRMQVAAFEAVKLSTMKGGPLLDPGLGHSKMGLHPRVV